MAPFAKVIRCEATDGIEYFADVGAEAIELPVAGVEVSASISLDGLVSRRDLARVALHRLLAPLPYEVVPIYCAGLNFRTHAEEAGLQVPSHPPLWTKPAAALAHPGEQIPINAFCAQGLPDYEGELVFVTSKECRYISPAEAEDYVLGYTVGNDLSCRKFQHPSVAGGQFFFAKAFDRFAPIGPALISPGLYAQIARPVVITKVNGQIRQEADLQRDMIFAPGHILSNMSHGTAIPAGTAVMTGTSAGVGAFMKPKTFLQDGDVASVELAEVGVLRNQIKFQSVAT